jgi:ribosomal protein S18 acetylase RimI-like enzyme
MKLNELHDGAKSTLIFRQLTPADAVAFRTLRLQSLDECAYIYGASYAEECDLPIEIIGDQLAGSDNRAVIGAFSNGELVAIASVTRSMPMYEAHKACIWGVYVSSEWRGAGVGKSLMSKLIYHARQMPRIIQLALLVNADNIPAIKLYEGLGFKCCGIEPNAIFAEDIFHDQLFMVFRFSAISPPSTLPAAYSAESAEYADLSRGASMRPPVWSRITTPSLSSSNIKRNAAP